MTYTHFMRSAKWQEIKRQAIKYFGGKRCQVCQRTIGPRGQSIQIEFHHIYYPVNLADTKPNHLMPLCRAHHIQVDLRSDRGRAGQESGIESMRAKIMAQEKMLHGKHTRKDKWALRSHRNLDREFEMAVMRDKE